MERRSGFPGYCDKPQEAHRQTFEMAQTPIRRHLALLRRGREGKPDSLEGLVPELPSSIRSMRFHLAEPLGNLGCPPVLDTILALYRLLSNTLNWVSAALRRRMSHRDCGAILILRTLQHPRLRSRKAVLRSAFLFSVF